MSSTSAVISTRHARTAYWLLVLLLFLPQAAYTWVGLERLWYEELAEGIRNPFWLDHRFVYDGASTNVAWYGLVLLADKVFGFSPYAGKYVRLVLHVPFLVCSALALERWVGVRKAWLPLVAVGLSPTLLYFNNLSIPSGVDVQLAPVFIWLIAVICARAHAASRLVPLGECLIGAAAMVACLTYPSFLLCLPVLAGVYIILRRPVATSRLFADFGYMALGFALPFGAVVAYLSDRRSFLLDPTTNGTGVFRGGGGQGVSLDPNGMWRSTVQVLHDLFVRGESYYFGLPTVEFSGRLGLIAAWGIIVGAIVAGWKWKPARQALALAGCLCLLAVVAPAASWHLPGLRRSTPFIAGAYVLMACVWAMPIFDDPVGRVLAWTGKAACVLLLVHHVMAYSPNLRYLVDETRKVRDPWFYQFGDPSQTVRILAREWVLTGKPLACGATSSCRFSEVYGAVAGYLKWSGLGEPPVLAVDMSSGRVIKLDIDLWQSRAFAH